MKKGDNDSHVRRYASRRYRSLDQRLVNALESAAVRRHLDAICREGDLVLDVPSGYGRFAEEVVKRGAEVVVADKKQSMLALTRERLGEAVKPVRLLSANLPFPDKSFDVVLCIRLLQHLHDPAVRLGTLQEIARVCRRAAVISTYMESPLHSLLHRARGLKNLSQHSAARLAHDLEQAGLRQLELSKPLTRLHAQTILLVEPIR